MNNDFKIPPVYWIEWVDSSTTGGWKYKVHQIDTDLRCRTIGFLVGEDDDAVTVSSSLSSNGAVLDPITIPRCSITRMQEVVWG